ncbi:preprotein translocase subunit SecE [bacterium]|nr:preprotein translocase subunit SecE [bacterium]
MAKKEKNLEVKEKTTKKKETNKNGIWAKTVLFFKGVKSEWKRVKWPSKKEMIKYSVATIILVVGCSVFFYVIDVLLAFLHSLGK